MKKLLMTASAVALFAGFSAPAQAECDGPYVALRAGMAKYDISGGDVVGPAGDDERLMISGALGWRHEYFRTEFEYIWRKHSEDTVSFETSKFKTYSYMLNFYYDVFPYNWWTPYVNAGVGLTKLKYSAYDNLSGIVNTKDRNYDPLNFTWSVGAGLSMKVTNRFNVDLGYRYFDMGHNGAADVTTQEIYGGVRYVF